MTQTETEVRTINGIQEPDIVRRTKRGRRWYQHPLTGEEIPGATTVLGIKSNPALIGWARKRRAELMEHAVRNSEQSIWTEKQVLEMIDSTRSSKLPTDEADYGTRLHTAAEQFLNGITPKVDEDISTAWLGFLSWWKSQEAFVDQLYSEVPVWHPDGYAGTADVLMLSKEGMWNVIDFKTSKAVYDDHALQLVAYQRAAEATFELGNVDGLKIIRFGKVNPEVEIHSVNPVMSPIAWDRFRRRLDLFNADREKVNFWDLFDL